MCFNQMNIYFILPIPQLHAKGQQKYAEGVRTERRVAIGLSRKISPMLLLRVIDSLEFGVRGCTRASLKRSGENTKLTQIAVMKHKNRRFH